MGKGSSDDNIKVICRVRPLNKKELAKGDKEAVNVTGNQVSMMDKPDKKYNFDAVIGPNFTQAQVYDTAAKHVLEDVLNGYNGTIFAYGQTASGKTFTMEGALKDKENQGIIPRLVLAVFKYIEDTGGWNFTIQIAYFEIYNERIKDLLNPNTGDNLPISEDRKKRPYVKNLTEISAGSPKEVMKYIESGKKNRVVGKTNMNEHSSRSHAVFVMNIGQENQDSGEKRTGQLYMVDLAGSEKVGKTGATGQTLDEAKNINKSLSCLGNVISALLDKGKSHVPYRDSKLTRILQQSLGGNAKTTMVICCSPASQNKDETTSTLLFGTRVKTIKNNVSANVEKSPDEWKRLYNSQMAKVGTIKELALKLCAEAKDWRKGKQPKQSKRIKIEELEKLLNNLDCSTDGEPGDPKTTEAEVEAAKGKERLKSKLSKTSLAVTASKAKGKRSSVSRSKSRHSKAAKNTQSDTSAEGGIEQSEKLKETAENHDIPEDVLAVLQAEIQLKTEELEEERQKLQKQLDEKDDEIHDLTQKIKIIQGERGQHQEGLKGAARDNRNAMQQITDLQQQVEQHKERNNRLKQALSECQQEGEAARTELNGKDNELREKDAKLNQLVGQATQITEALEQAKQELAQGDEKNGAKLILIAEELSSIGKTMVGEENQHHFNYRPPDPKRPKEIYACVRSLLAKNKHFAALVNKKISQLKLEMEELKNKMEMEGNDVTEMKTILQQAKEKMAEMQERIKELEQQNGEMQEKIAKRDGMIMKLGGGENADDEDLDPDLKMVQDEHKNQLRQATAREQEAREKYEDALREKDKMAVENEKLKAEVDRLKKEFAKQKQDLQNEAEFIAAHGGGALGAQMIDNDLLQEMERLNNIKKSMTDKFKSEIRRMRDQPKQPEIQVEDEAPVPEGEEGGEGLEGREGVEGGEGAEGGAGGADEGSAGGDKPTADIGASAAPDGDIDPATIVPQEDDGQGDLFPVGSAAQRQIQYLETTLDEVTKQQHELAKENRQLKQKIADMEGQVGNMEVRHSIMSSVMRDDQEEAMKEREELRDQVDDYRAKSLVKKNSGTIYRTLKKESLKYSMGKSGSKSFNEQDEDEDDDML
ncbi:uncharacterized protein LOC142349142 [Convolutriloba macropyga]|uniref:uncharacterized protein LOC142349142 n=1 Tax=Convolutriloba macropyga TaxID=536237 RepID=UPI003F524A63